MKRECSLLKVSGNPKIKMKIAIYKSNKSECILGQKNEAKMKQSIFTHLELLAHWLQNVLTAGKHC